MLYDQQTSNPIDELFIGLMPFMTCLHCELENVEINCLSPTVARLNNNNNNNVTITSKAP